MCVSNFFYFHWIKHFEKFPSKLFLWNERRYGYIQRMTQFFLFEFCCWCVDCCGSTSTESDRFVSWISECYSWFLVFLSHRVLFFPLSVLSFCLSFYTHSFVCSKFLLSFSHSSSSSSSSSSSFFCSFIRWYFFCYLHFCLLPVFFCVYNSAYHETVTLIKHESL